MIPVRMVIMMERRISSAESSFSVWVCVCVRARQLRLYY